MTELSPTAQARSASASGCAPVRDPTTRTILQQDGPNHLGLWYNALPEHKIGPYHLGIVLRALNMFCQHSHL